MYDYEVSRDYRILYTDVFTATFPIDKGYKAHKGPFFLEDTGDTRQNWNYRFFIDPSDPNFHNKSLYPGRYGLSSWTSVDFSLVVGKRRSSDLPVRYWLYIRGTDGKRHYVHEGLETFAGHKATSVGSCHIEKSSLESKKKKGLLLHDGDLIVECKIQVLEKIEQHPKMVEAEQRIAEVNVKLIEANDTITVQTQKLAQSDKTLAEYGSLLETGALSDVVIVACGKEFNAHKLILSFRSPVFEAMFEHEMAEKKHARVMIEDMEPEACGEMLRYMYTGKLENLVQWAMELFVAADKYQIDSLKAKCEQHLLNSINSQNVCEILLLADLHQSTQLKPKCIDFIRYNSTQVQTTEGWNKLAVSRPDLALELGLNLN